MHSQNDLNLDYLQNELARIDLLIRRQVLQWQHAGQNPADAFRGLSISTDEAQALIARPFATDWGHTVSDDHSQLQSFTAAQEQIARRSQALIDQAWQAGQTLRLEQLAVTFGLDDFDLDTLLICLAPSLDLRYERLYGFLQDDVTRKRPTVNLVLDLLCDPGPERLLMLSHFYDDASLVRRHLIERVNLADRAPLLSTSLHLDESIVAWLLGWYRPHQSLGAHAALETPAPRQADDLLVAPVRSNLEHALAIERPLIVFYGPDQASQAAGARLIAARTGRPLLTVDLEAVVNAGADPLLAVELALRDARLTGAAPYLTGWDALHKPDNAGVRASDLLAQLHAHPNLLIVASRSIWQPGGIDRDRPFIWIEFPIPSHVQRLALWQHFLDRDQMAEGDITPLAGQFMLTTSQIRDAVASARDRATLRGEPLAVHDLLAAARAHSSPGLAGLARKITPRYTWEDIVLPGDQAEILREIVSTVRGRPVVLDEWGVGKKLAASNGVTMLFAGPPGTGKTMAAEVIASELGLDLYKIDLSTIVSKYIGETEKNLERIFSEAQSSNSILFFDEADAIFGKRSEVKDAHDRYANIEISYLLQRMEAYDGVTILATNLRANLDDAFTRRLQFAVDFPFPEEEYRRRIWQTLFPPEVPREADLDFALLARRFKLAGGNIRNIIVSAAYLAASDGGRVTMNHMLHGARRELQKMGRLVNEKDLAM
jgi:ATP-dependent 26S proteasome regulatory subunit